MELRCQVSVVGAEGIEHLVTVSATSVFHAAGLGMRQLRAHAAAAAALDVGTPVVVRVDGRVYRVRPIAVERWLHSTSRSPGELLRKRSLLPTHTRR